VEGRMGERNLKGFSSNDHVACLFLTRYGRDLDFSLFNFFTLYFSFSSHLAKLHHDASRKLTTPCISLLLQYLIARFTGLPKPESSFLLAW
jgi:hypothetical protein